MIIFIIMLYGCGFDSHVCHICMFSSGLTVFLLVFLISISKVQSLHVSPYDGVASYPRVFPCLLPCASWAGH